MGHDDNAIPLSKAGKYVCHCKIVFLSSMMNKELRSFIIPFVKSITILLWKRTRQKLKVRENHHPKM